MRPVHIGQDANTGTDIRVPPHAFSTHLHLIGGTGKGKTTAIHTMLHTLLADPHNKACFFIVDRFGSFSQELLLWMSSRFCPEHVRRRLVYIQGANEEIVPTLNPLTFSTPGECYFKVERATEIILRAWESVNIEAMPRLARWTFNSFMASAQLGLTIADCCHFLMPGSPYHKSLLELLPPLLQAEWAEIMRAKGQAVIQTLDSSRNRLKPYFESVILRRMFGSTRSRLDVARMMDEGRIVLVDLAPRNRLSPQLANTIGALLINEIIATIRSLMPDVKHQTFLFLDEFQNFVGPDVESALPEMRQMGLNLILSHQSLSQLVRGDYDMTRMIFAAQSRMIFGVQGEDADILANEVASLSYNSRKIKEEIFSKRQLITGHRVIELSSWSESQGKAEQWSETFGKTQSDGRSDSRKEFHRYSLHGDPTITTSRQQSTHDSGARGGSSSYNTSSGKHQSLMPEYEQFYELASRTYESFEEQMQQWASEIRRLSRGQALMRLVDDPRLYRVNVKKSTPGFLAYDTPTIKKRFSEVYDRMQQMIEANFQSDFFVPAHVIDREAQERIERIVRRRIVLDAPATPSGATAGGSEKNSGFAI